MDKELHAGRILRMPEVCQYTGIRRSSVYRKLAEGSGHSSETTASYTGGGGVVSSPNPAG